MLGAAQALWSRRLWPEGKPRVERHLAAWLQDMNRVVFADVEAISALGSRYAAQTRDDVQGLPHAALGAERLSQGRLQELADRIALDWRQHHVVVVDGWLLARTEARLCSIVWSARGGTDT